MKKVLFVLVALIVGGARADNIVTSREYVDSQANTLQTKLPAKNTNTVLLNTDTAGEVGAKAIYDASAAFGTQTDTLVTAGTFNTAVQNALDSEFVCIERQNGNGGCLLYEIRSTTQKQILPAGYTQLEYLESTGTQYINTGQKLYGTDTVEIKYSDLIKGASNDNMLFGHYSDTAIAYNLMGNMIGVYFKSKIGAFTSKIDASDTSVHTIKLGNRRLYFDNELKLTLNRETDFQTAKPICLFSADSNYRSIAKIYYYKAITASNQIIQNLIPARRDSDNALGMYDTVSGTFFTNAGTGDFIAGPVVSSNLYLPSGQ